MEARNNNTGGGAENLPTDCVRGDKVRAWWEIDKNGKMKQCNNPTHEAEREEEEKNLIEVHVWEQKSLATCKEELLA